MRSGAPLSIAACMLAGGEGRRMQGQDKGLMRHRGRPLGDWVLESLAGQAGVRIDALWVSANRNRAAYAELLAAHCREGMQAGGVLGDDADLPPSSGPLAGVVTLLRHVAAPGQDGVAPDWLLVVPCDTPHLPADLVARLLSEALRAGADVAVPRTLQADGTERFHWACVLIHKRVCPHTEALFVTGERKLSVWVRGLKWAGVSFADDAAFTNMNTLETLHGRA